MNKLITSIAVVATLCLSSVSGKFGFGGCPKFTSIPYTQDMADLGKFHLHYVDKFVNNAFTLFNLIVNKKY